MPNVARALTTLIAALVAMLGLGASTDAVGTPAPATAVAYVYDAPAFPTIPASSRVDRGPPTKAYDYASMLAVDPSPNISTHPKGAGNSAFTAYDVTAKVARVNEGTGATRGKAQAIDGDFNGLESAGVAAKTESGLIRLSTEESWANSGTLTRHFRDHGADFAAASADDYARMASEFFQRGGAQQLPTKIASDGTIRMFDPATNTFGSFAPNGMTKTFFKPTSSSYWSRQPGVLQ